MFKKDLIIHSNWSRSGNAGTPGAVDLEIGISNSSSGKSETLPGMIIQGSDKPGKPRKNCFL